MTIQEVTERIIDYRGKTPPKSPAGVKLLTAKVIKSGSIDESRLEYVDEGTYATWMRRGFPQLGDVLLTTEAPLGEVAMLRTPERIALAQRVILLRGDPKLVDRRYLFAAMRSPLVQARLQARATGTTVLGIKQKELRLVEIPLPPLALQETIGAVVSAYDDLIENNARRISILEEMAQAIYREWFVEFRYPGDAGVPLVGSDLGPIPEGWILGHLRDVVELAYGKGLKASDRRGGPIPVYGSGGVVGSHDTALVQGPGIVVGRKGNVGSVHWSDASFFPIDTTYFVKTDLPLTYVNFALRDLKFIDSHAAVPGLSRDQAYGLPFLVPKAEVLQQFDEVISRMFALRLTFIGANVNLRTTRALLLPRLISGEIDVSGLDIVVADAAA
jgi:type I restriction enzyme S subunit